MGENTSVAVTEILPGEIAPENNKSAMTEHDAVKHFHDLVDHYLTTPEGQAMRTEWERQFANLVLYGHSHPEIYLDTEGSKVKK